MSTPTHSHDTPMGVPIYSLPSQGVFSPGSGSNGAPWEPARLRRFGHKENADGEGRGDDVVSSSAQYPPVGGTVGDGPRVAADTLAPSRDPRPATSGERCAVCAASHERRSLYCSPRCRRVAKERRQRERKRVQRSATCQTCGRSWLLEVGRAGLLPRFCGESCRRARVRSCEVCGVSSVERPGSWRRWCSPGCRDRAAATARSAARAERGPGQRRRVLRRPPQRFCSSCGGPFEPRDRRNYYCSPSCRARDRWFSRPVAQRRAKSRRAAERGRA